MLLNVPFPSTLPSLTSRRTSYVNKPNETEQRGVFHDEISGHVRSEQATSGGIMSAGHNDIQHTYVSAAPSGAVTAGFWASLRKTPFSRDTLNAPTDVMPSSRARAANSGLSSRDNHIPDASSSNPLMKHRLVVGAIATCAVTLLCVTGCTKCHRRHRQRKQTTRRHTKAATSIQARWRGWVMASRYRRRRSAATFLITAGRGALERVDARRRRVKAAALIQTRWRVWEKMERYRRSQRAAAVVLQAVGRGALVRRNAYGRTVAAICIQTVWRGWIKVSRYRRRQRAGEFLRASGRRAVLRLDATRYRRRHRAAEILHTYGLNALRRARIRRHLKAITVIQARWRGWMTESRYRRRRFAATFLITAGRGALERANARRRRGKAAALIQTRWRVRAKVECYHRRQRAAAVVLQAVGRGALVRRNAYGRTVAAICIQTVWRGWIKVSRYRRRQRAGEFLRASGRRAVLRLDATRYRRRHRAAEILHTYGLNALRRARIRRHLKAITVIQARWRGWRNVMNYRRTHCGIVMVQAVGRGYLVRVQTRRHAKQMEEAKTHRTGGDAEASASFRTDLKTIGRLLLARRRGLSAVRFARKLMGRKRREVRACAIY